MAEEKKEDTEEKPEVVKEVKKRADSLVDNANKAALRLEEANEKREELLDREERLRVEERLSGRTEAGQESKPKEESSVEYADRVLAGKMEK